ncbi:SDR family NAD(P)-dependent oxidoreductase [Tenuibacillus multivorans]|uniref:NAD(P)-dependent dehydrogenase, short-chain alcohol dehydrogenase family n=1 Tax=Tenuibacillus multivorans TaxID=237069 RepID=A0A1H0B6H2_9BACI|nr:SDR family oxidoreductase [Tenuibacillus multivorans]GEL78625.1 3-oxoacyl-ACP reductase [Tenuibacillus multivorans]SDN41226.1 NAD(P)-dependent dehydrogenase, short-chain alcohol dehydrogenase family [Tenuibacillus multivorans]
MNRKIVITGGTKGLGKALALAFAKEGDAIAICARNEAGLNDMKILLHELGAHVLAIQADVANEVDVERFVSSVEAKWGHIDILINNASIYGSGPTLLADYPINQFKEVMDVNVMNPLLMTQRVLPGMLQRDKGLIVNITSEAGHHGYPGWGAYGVSKFGLEGLTEIWAAELKESNINVHMIDPGEMDTAMHDLAVPDCDYELADPNDVAKAIVYLASESKQFNDIRLTAEELLEVSQHGS